MSRSLLAAAGAVAIALSMAQTASAVTQTKYFEFPAADACQLSIPTTDTSVRPRANGYRNEGTTNQFAICGMGGYENNTVVSTTLIVTSMDGIAHSMSCTGVTGLIGWGGPYYSTKTVNAPATGYGAQTWNAGDFGGTAGNPIFGGLNISVTCTLPPNVAIQQFESTQKVDVGA